MGYFSNVIIYFEWLAFICSFMASGLKYPKPMRLFSWVLGTIVVAEILAKYLADKFHHNGIVYNILDFIWFPGYMYIFYLIIKNRKFKQYIRYILGFFYLFATVNFIWFQNDHRWLAHRTFVVGSLAVVTCALFALIELSNDQKQHNLKTDPVFWIAIAMLFYFFPSAIVIEGFDYFEYKDKPISDAYGYAVRYSQKILNVIHYTLLSYAFVCRSIFKNVDNNLNTKVLFQNKMQN